MDMVAFVQTTPWYISSQCIAAREFYVLGSHALRRLCESSGISVRIFSNIRRHREPSIA